MSVREQAHEVVLELWDEAADVYASRLAYVESRAAIAARGRASRRDRRRLVQAKAHLDDRWERIAVVELDDLVRKVAALASEQHRLRGADAVHLASAAVLGSGVTMVTRDGDLRRASLAVGLRVAP